MNTAQQVTISDSLAICNDYCHKCRQAGLLEFTGQVDRLERAHMVCSNCGKKEYRKAYRVKP